MTNLKELPTSFSTDRMFYDDKNYPRGLAKSGDFSLSESKIMEQYGVALKALAEQSRAPMTDEEMQFVEVCVNQLEPVTPIEKAWVKYQNKTLTPKHFHTLFGRSKVESEDDDEGDPDDTDLD
ncbi:DUF413 domain-containing protein [Colwellia sp. E2M01]|uniref:DUF413 domain-containing protein n=1 Tax=Colwellia sp. E2M01 TaxID=2841561 RepID=UPI001C09BCEE|nr:DUF413 domain-containing protein [Colwellia sp. E2M01]MBU2870776.1 DUF413 domain-containing protein [Colwellia sp. E2M01]